MLFSQKFISFSRKTCTLNDWVAAPYMRRDFVITELPQKAELTVCALGFYEVYVNGKRITKGHLSPYIVNPIKCYRTIRTMFPRFFKRAKT